MRKVRWLALAVATASLTAVAVVAQQQAPPPSAPPQGPVFRARADLVPVYVVAVDNNNQPVHGLTKDDFLLYDRKKPQDIAVFEEVVHEAEPVGPLFTLPPSLKRDVSSNHVDKTDRLVVIVVDDLHIYKGRADRAKDLVKQLIDRLGNQTTMALLFTSGDRSTQVTEDRADVVAAVDHLKGRRGVRRPADAVDSQVPRFVDPEDVNAMAAAHAAAASTSLQDFYDNMSYYKTLQDAARLLSANDGRRKVFVLISEGIGKDLAWLPGMRSACGTIGGPPSGEASSIGSGDSGPADEPSQRGAGRQQGGAPPGLPPPAGACFHDNAVLQMIDTMQRSNIATYAIDPRGEVTAQDLIRECSPQPGGFGVDDPCSFGLTDFSGLVRLAQHGLQFTAEVSGGFAVTNTNDFAGGLDRIVSDLDNYYVLGFYPADSGGGYRQLSVTTSRTDLGLRYRLGYELGQPAPAKSADQLTALAVAAMPNPDLPLRVFAAPFPGVRSGTTRVAVTIEITEPRRDLADAQGHIADDVSYSVFAADTKSGKVVQQLRNTAHVTSIQPFAASAPPGIPYQMPMTMTLSPGHYQLRATALSARLKKGGSVYLTLDVPDFTHDSLMLSGLVVGYADHPRVISARPATPADLVPFDPSLDREFMRADTIRLLFDVVRKDGSRAAKTTIALVDTTDHVAASVDEPVGAGAPGRIDVVLPLKTLVPGAYRVRVTATDGKSKAEHEVGLVVR
jgi:VWFA-related protein